MSKSNDPTPNSPVPGSHSNQPTDDTLTPVLALRPREAARALGIGERKLWAMTNAGELPHARIGRAVVYPVRELQMWLSEQAGEGGRR